MAPAGSGTKPPKPIKGSHRPIDPIKTCGQVRIAERNERGGHLDVAKIGNRSGHLNPRQLSDLFILLQADAPIIALQEIRNLSCTSQYR